MRNISQEEAFVKGFLRRNPNALAPSVRGGVIVDAHVSGVTVVADGTYHLILHRGCIIDVLHEASCGICFREGREGVEEVVAFITIREDIAGYAHSKDD